MDNNIISGKAHQTGLVEIAATIVSAYVSNNSVPAAELPALLSSVHAAVAGLGSPSSSAAPALDKPTPAQIRKSITRDALISFVDGRPYKTLKRHLSTHGLTFEEYRRRYGLPRDYPTTAASYSEQRSTLAKNIGLGQQRRQAAAKATRVAATVTNAPKAYARDGTAEPAAKSVKARKSKKDAVAAE